MKTIACILLLFMILLQTFTSFVYDAAYSLNKKYIAKNFCVNKDKPAMQCNGHCYLNKQKAKEEGNDKQSTENKKDKVEVAAYEIIDQVITNSFVPARTTISFNSIAHKTLTGYFSSIFRPPLFNRLYSFL